MNSAVETRNASFFQHRDSGKLCGQQRTVMLFFHRLGNEGKDFTLREIELETGISVSSVSARCNELKNMEPPFLVEAEQRPCTLTGITVTPLKLTEVRHAQNARTV